MKIPQFWQKRHRQITLTVVGVILCICVARFLFEFVDQQQYNAEKVADHLGAYLEKNMPGESLVVQPNAPIPGVLTISGSVADADGARKVRQVAEEWSDFLNPIRVKVTVEE